MTADQKHKAGFFVFADDWRGDEALAMCSEGARLLWFEMLLVMNKADGYMLINGRTPTPAQIAAITRTDPGQVDSRLAELRDNGVYSVTKGGVIYSRRMVRDDKKARTARENGRRGGNPALRKRGESVEKNGRIDRESSEMGVGVSDGNESEISPSDNLYATSRARVSLALPSLTNQEEERFPPSPSVMPPPRSRDPGRPVEPIDLFAVTPISLGHVDNPGSQVDGRGDPVADPCDPVDKIQEFSGLVAQAPPQPSAAIQATGADAGMAGPRPELVELEAVPPHRPAPANAGPPKAAPIAGVASPGKAPRTKPRSIIPEDLGITDKGTAYAVAKGLPPDAIPVTWERFVNHHRGRGTLIADIEAAWRTWVMNEERFAPKPMRSGVPALPSARGTGPPASQPCKKSLVIMDLIKEGWKI